MFKILGMTYGGLIFSDVYNEVRKRFLLYLPCFVIFLMSVFKLFLRIWKQNELMSVNALMCQNCGFYSYLKTCIEVALFHIMSFFFSWQCFKKLCACIIICRTLLLIFGSAQEQKFNLLFSKSALCLCNGFASVAVCNTAKCFNWQNTHIKTCLFF